VSTTTDATAPTITHLRAGGTSLVLDTAGPHLPRVLHWGADLGEPSGEELEALRTAVEPQVASSQLDAAVPVGVLPEQRLGWLGTPGLSGHRDGRDFSPRFTVRTVERTASGAPLVEQVRVEAEDERAQLELVLEVGLGVSGVVAVRASVTNA
jgi:alpha-galactosidase